MQPDTDASADDVELILWNVLEEKTGSSCCQRRLRPSRGRVLEVFLSQMSDAQLRFLLHKMTGYMSHLWTNRYSSHVLQHVLSRSSVVVAKERNGLEEDTAHESDDRMTDIPSMSNVIVAMVKEVEQAVLAVLAGKPLVPEKRGKKAKHRVVTFTEAHPSTEGSEATYDVPGTFEKLYKELLAG